MPLSLFPDGVLPALAGRDAERSRALDMSNPAIRAFVLGTGAYSGSAILSLNEAWRNSVWVRACVEAIGTTIAQLPFEVYRGSDLVTTHPALDFIAAPNPTLGLSSHDLWVQTLMIRELYGECFWVLGRGPRGAVNEVSLYNPHLVKPVERLVYDEKLGKKIKRLVAWEFSFGDGTGETMKVDPLDVAQFARFDPIKYRPMTAARGTSALESAGLAVSTDVAAARYNHAFFERGAYAGAILSTEDEVDFELDSGKQLLDRIKSTLVGKYHEPLVLTGKWKYDQATVGARDSEFIAGRKLNREEIIAAFKTPPVVVGILEYASYANANQQIRQWWQVCLKPIIASVCSVFDTKILIDPALSSEFNTDNVAELQEPLKDKIDTAAKLFAMGVPYNVIDERLDIGTGPVPGGEVGYLPFSLAPAEQVANPPEPAPVAPPAQTQPPTPGSGEPAPPTTDVPPADVAKTVGLDLDRIAQGILRATRPIIVPARRSLEDILKLIAKIIESDDGKLKKFSLAFFEQALQTGGDQMLQLMGIDVGFDITNPEAQSFLEEKLIKITDINQTTEDRVRSVISTGIADGQSIDEIAKSVKDGYNFTTSRARVIARTETSQAVNGGRFIVLQDEGAETHEWLDSNDERVRDSHAAEDGNVVKVGETFPVTGLEYPGDPNGDPAEIINCRCISLPVDSKRAVRVNARDNYWRAAVSEWAPIERRFEKAIRKYLFEQRAAVLAALANA